MCLTVSDFFGLYAACLLSLPIIYLEIVFRRGNVNKLLKAALALVAMILFSPIIFHQYFSPEPQVECKSWYASAWSPEWNAIFQKEAEDMEMQRIEFEKYSNKRLSRWTALVEQSSFSTNTDLKTIVDAFKAHEEVKFSVLRGKWKTRQNKLHAEWAVLGSQQVACWSFWNLCISDLFKFTPFTKYETDPSDGIKNDSPVSDDRPPRLSLLSGKDVRYIRKKNMAGDEGTNDGERGVQVDEDSDACNYRKKLEAERQVWCNIFAFIYIYFALRPLLIGKRIKSVAAFKPCIVCHENHGQEKPKQCCVCMEREVNRYSYPCGHTELCHECSIQVNDTCPICRAPVTAFYPAFL